MKSYTIDIGVSGVLFQCQATDIHFYLEGLGYLRKGELKRGKFQKAGEQPEHPGKVWKWHTVMLGELLALDGVITVSSLFR